MIQRKAFLFITLLTIQFLVISSAFAQLTQRVVRVGVYQNAPQVFIDESGTPQGIYVDILNEVARLEGWKLEYVQGSFADHLNSVREGSIDMLASIAATPERKQLFDFSAQTIVSVWAQLYLKPSLSPENILGLDGMNIAVMRDGILGKKFQELCVNFGITCHILPVVSYDAALQAVDDGKVDGAVVNSILGFSREKNYKAVRSSIVFSPLPLQLALPKGKNADLIAALDGHLAVWRTDKTSIYYQIIDRWLGLKAEVTSVVPQWLKWVLAGGGISITLFFLWVTFLRKEVNQRKKVEVALRQSDERYHQILENMSSGVVIYRAVDNASDFVFADVNLAAERIDGIRKSQIIGKRLTDVFPSVEEFGVLDVLRRVWRTGKPERFPVTLYQDNRISGWRDNYIYKLPTGEVVAMYDDVTERKQIENDLRESAKNLNESQRIAHIGSWYLDLKTNQVSWSEELYKMYDFDPDLSPPPYAESKKLFTPESWDALSSAISKTTEIGIPYELELEIVREGGPNGWMWAQGEAVYDQNDKIVGLRGVTQDISERKRTETVLEIAKAEAENANKTKSEFLAAMSHDLRTPLNAIMGFSDMMRTQTFGPLGSPHYEGYANDIHSSGELLVSLINDVLDLSKIEAGKYDLTEEPLDISLLIQTSFKQLRPMAAASQHTLSFDVPTDMPSLLGDERAITQILNNLLSNAIKFTPDGEVIKVTARLDENDGITLTVKDTGIGMSEDGIAKALRPYEQADGMHSKRHEGTGLGLHLCSNLMLLFGGHIDIQSKEDVGTTITLRFPPKRTIHLS